MRDSPSSTLTAVMPGSALLGTSTARYLLYGVIVGAVVGTPILGVGGRIVMRIFSIVTDAPGGFTLGGTMTVILMGMLSGIGGGAISAIIHRFVPGPAFIRTALLALACGLLTMRGLHPVRLLPLALFVPLVVAYVAVLDIAWRKRRAAIDVIARREHEMAVP